MDPNLPTTAPSEVLGSDLAYNYQSDQELLDASRNAHTTPEIVRAHVTRNTIAVADLGDLIGAVGSALEALGREKELEPVPTTRTSGATLIASLPWLLPWPPKLTAGFGE